MNIPIPDLLLRLREKGKKEKAAKSSIKTPGFKMWSYMATQPAAWKTALKLGHAMNITPHAFFNVHPAAKAWRQSRDLPSFAGGDFRKWFKERKARKGAENE